MFSEGSYVTLRLFMAQLTVNITWIYSNVVVEIYLQVCLLTFLQVLLSMINNLLARASSNWAYKRR